MQIGMTGFEPRRQNKKPSSFSPEGFCEPADGNTEQLY